MKKYAIEIINNDNILKTWYRNITRPAGGHFDTDLSLLITGRAYYSQLIIV